MLLVFNVHFGDAYTLCTLYVQIILGSVMVAEWPPLGKEHVKRIVTGTYGPSMNSLRKWLSRYGLMINLHIKCDHSFKGVLDIDL